MPVETYLDSIVRPLLSTPDKLSIVKTQDERGVLLTVDVDRTDMGRVIGKEGSIANAIRAVVRSYGMIKDARVSVKINEPVYKPYRKTEDAPAY